MSKNQDTIPEKAVLTEDVEQIICDNCFEEYLFHLKDSVHEFSIGLLDILNCLQFAEEQGAVPELPPEWWIDVKSHFGM